jgi:hypothetical protein
MSVKKIGKVFQPTSKLLAPGLVSRSMLFLKANLIRAKNILWLWWIGGLKAEPLLRGIRWHSFRWPSPQKIPTRTRTGLQPLVAAIGRQDHHRAFFHSAVCVSPSTTI